MAPHLVNTHSKIAFNLILMLAILAAFFVNTTPVLAEENSDTTLPDFAAFSQSVWNGQANELRGVYVPQVLAMPVIQQPTGNAGFVSSTDDVITQFGMAAQFGNVGLLAHNYLAGTKFPMLAAGMEVNLVYGDGRVESFVISRIVQYQAIDPFSVYSEFRDLGTGTTLTAQQLFDEVYRGDRRVTFQTCIAANGNSSWGRLFVIAEPKPIVFADYFRLSKFLR